MKVEEFYPHFQYLLWKQMTQDKHVILIKYYLLLKVVNLLALLGRVSATGNKCLEHLKIFYDYNDYNSYKISWSEIINIKYQAYWNIFGLTSDLLLFWVR